MIELQFIINKAAWYNHIYFLRSFCFSADLPEDELQEAEIPWKVQKDLQEDFKNLCNYNPKVIFYFQYWIQ